MPGPLRRFIAKILKPHGYYETAIRPRRTTSRRITLAFSERSGPDINLAAIAIEAVRVRRGHRLRLIVPGPENVRSKPVRRNDKLVALVADARQARELVLAKPEQSIASVAREQGCCRNGLTKLVALSCLAPDIVTAIVEGKQPEHLTANRLTGKALALSWAEQRAALGFS